MTDAEALKVAIEACRTWDVEHHRSWPGAKEAAARLERLAPFVEAFDVWWRHRTFDTAPESSKKWGKVEAAFIALSTEETTKP